MAATKPFDGIQEFTACLPLYMLTILMQYSATTGHYYQPPVNHRELNFSDLTLGRSEGNTEPIVETVFSNLMSIRDSTQEGI